MSVSASVQILGRRGRRRGFTGAASGDKRQEFKSAFAVKIHLLDSSLLAAQNMVTRKEVSVELMDAMGSGKGS